MTLAGVQSHPFTAATFPPVQASPFANPELIKKRSRARIGVPREEVRKSIEERMRFDTITQE